MSLIEWNPQDLHLRLAHGDHPVQWDFLAADADSPNIVSDHMLVEVFTSAEMHTIPTQSYSHSTVGGRLRYADHSATADELRVRQRDETTGIEVETAIRAAGPGLQVASAVRNTGAGDVVLTAVTSLAFATASGEHDLLWGDSAWIAEGRWHRAPVAEVLPDLHFEHRGGEGKDRFALTSRGSWSTGDHLPTGALASDGGPSIAWQVETSAGWHWEAVRTEESVRVAVLGPTDTEHQAARRLAPGEEFTTVPAGLVVAAGGPDAAFAALTDYRRAIRVRHRADDALPVVYNDYMNTLMGSPTTEKLLPLVESASAAGAEYFCIDAGWFAEGEGFEGWWSGVGAWREAAHRFPGGLKEVIDAIRAAGMTPGLWLEPEVVGIDSPVADLLPEEAFFRRFGTRLAEGGRYHLDFRHPAARAHLDETVDRLIAEHGTGFFKLDYNINPGAGTETDATSPGAGLLDHSRAYRQWLLDVQDRHPDLVIEACSSGAMRMDYGLLSAVHMQSTSDQEDFRRYPAVAAAAPAGLVPEQAGNWAYPAPGMSEEETAFAMVAGVMGRLYLSGFLYELGAEQRALVHEAVALHKDWRGRIAASHPAWPLGLPGWDDDVIALAFETEGETLLAVWSRGEATEVPLPGLRGRELEQRYPAALPEWEVADADGVPTVRVPAGPAARIFYSSTQ
ncbi:glycoside hydrolase family 36 protein [Glycomyces salinus]|uniref:glycoside hydrolase family 36 protein n=1 Tax=Glycomyces salinus TaxID=980294 RepID=UPI0018EC23B9|nr:glycoside hydrolase family 36 protein [Glycomyces salinus]